MFWCALKKPLKKHPCGLTTLCNLMWWEFCPWTHLPACKCSLFWIIKECLSWIEIYIYLITICNNTICLEIFLILSQAKTINFHNWNVPFSPFSSCVWISVIYKCTILVWFSSRHVRLLSTGGGLSSINIDIDDDEDSDDGDTLRFRCPRRLASPQGKFYHMIL